MLKVNTPCGRRIDENENSVSCSLFNKVNIWKNILKQVYVLKLKNKDTIINCSWLIYGLNKIRNFIIFTYYYWPFIKVLYSWW